MLYRFEDKGSSREFLIMLVVCMVAFIASLYISQATENITIRYGFYFICGILAMGVYHRVRILLRSGGSYFEFTEDEFSWQTTGSSGSSSWDEISTLVLSRRGAPILHFQKRDGSRNYVPTSCLPAGAKELEEIRHLMKSKIVTGHPTIVFHMDEGR